MSNENNLDENIATIKFFINASKYHYTNLRNKLAEDNQPTINKEAFEGMVGNHKGLEIRVPATIEFTEGYAIELYEFYSFVSAVMASVNSIIDLKCRVYDCYSEHYSFSFGQYMNPQTRKKKLPSFAPSDAHELITENSNWIQEIKEIRDIVQHKPIQEFIVAHLFFKGERDEDGNIEDKSFVEKYVPLKNEDQKEISEFCNSNIINLENFWNDMKMKLNIDVY
ncbi:hypothetical protein [Methanococcoides sp. AM1]|uniref:hypothetical protein n=1 Tax=Methanococcoides sp. AM1 TaxID=1201011 RepID=UPI0014385511|nr:hypothetical protein [Methanococcoides sp. AM1]